MMPLQLAAHAAVTSALQLLLDYSAAQELLRCRTPGSGVLPRAIRGRLLLTLLAPLLGS
jgi:hypothetical protein